MPHIIHVRSAYAHIHIFLYMYVQNLSVLCIVPNGSTRPRALFHVSDPMFSPPILASPRDSTRPLLETALDLLAGAKDGHALGTSQGITLVTSLFDHVDTTVASTDSFWLLFDGNQVLVVSTHFWPTLFGTAIGVSGRVILATPI